jgi:hypothetical protein
VKLPAVVSKPASSAADKVLIIRMIFSVFDCGLEDQRLDHERDFQCANHKRASVGLWAPSGDRIELSNLPASCNSGQRK